VPVINFHNVKYIAVQISKMSDCLSEEDPLHQYFQSVEAKNLQPNVVDVTIVFFNAGR